ncbi:uncharacterized protein LOC118757389, partial [Rhagoletis pomonella]|uniref:uncharacterized protein LOC118757389 n=1 Tax=Rhagoletis pomonella TaxID=28610 RepID=UPI00177B2618
MAHLRGLALADPKYYQPKRIDLIIGADMIAQILEPETRIGHVNQPIAQKTHLGWILSGRINSDTPSIVTIRCHHSNLELEGLVRKFFENEHVPTSVPMSAQDQWCEDFFRSTYTRQANGKYLVRLPLKSLYDPNQTIGKSKQIALNRFHQLERRLQRNADLREQYEDGIEDYFRLNQIRPAMTTEEQHCSTTKCNQLTVTSCVLPHHAVVKETSVTTKLRIVYDASSKTSNGRSLNDLLCTGPPLQNDLSAVILKWRLHRYVFLADIQKMYRCIDMNLEDSNYQRILWRNKDGHVCEYCLTTVTFGTASAPYTAIRVLHQLAHDEKHRFPLAENILLHEMYVDDVLSGSDSIANARLLRDQLIAALKSAGMELRKWSSNTPELLHSIPYEHQSYDPAQQLNTNETIKTLGLHWQPNLDSFTFSVKFAINSSATKRSVLSTIARLFDPLGFLTPITVAAKVILKEIWATKIKRDDDHYVALGWDEELPPTINANWQRFVTELPQVKAISVPRWLHYSPQQQLQSVELHAFCDGSSSAYAAAVYLRLHYSKKDIYTHLVAAKSRVTPIGSLTIPRVELCGAVLALDLSNWVQNTLKPVYGKLPVYFWSDAIIVLYWIHGDLNRWKLYVANRISKILSHSTPSQWRHVGTKENPADCATRGLSPTQLKDLELWWNGPRWLTQPKSTWPTCSINALDVGDTTLEEKPAKVHIHAVVAISSFVQRFSSLKKLQRITAWMLRFYYNLQRKINHEGPKGGPLTP